MKKIIIILLIFSSLIGDEKKVIEEKVQPKNNPIKIEARLRDRTFIIGSLENQSIVVTTKYGNLNIDLGDINKIEFGMKISSSEESKLKQYISELKNGNEKDSQNAESKILDMGISVLPSLYKYSEKENNENQKLNSIIIELESTTSDDENISYNDKIFLNDDSIFSGEVNQENLIFKTNYGVLKAEKEKISNILFYSSLESGGLKKVYKLPANIYIPVNNTSSQTGYLDTKISIRKGETFEIKATGEISLASLSNSKFTPIGDSSKGSWMNIPFGALAAKIGVNGQPFLIGKRYKGIAKESGVIYLTISETVYN
ncbi:MAG: hypothetical protein KDK36_16250, partial [Leptospiraceae bacterium]|nr:hypothetical protein [Leptospiraceae bacterium]